MVSAAVAQDATVATIDSCVRRLNADTDIGYERIAARCPDLTRRLETSAWSAWLPHDWKRPGNDLSAAGLRELRDLLTHELTAPEPAATPSVTRLPQVLAALQSDAERAGWWVQTRAWLRDLLGRNEGSTDDGWLARLTGRIALSQAIIEIISYAALAVVVALACGIILNELRVAGVLGRLRKRFAPRVAPQIRARRASPAWEDVEAMPLRQRPRVLLELIVERLTADSCLPPARGLTVRELSGAARLPDERDRERLVELARTSERVCFSNEQVSSDALSAAVESGRALLQRISP